MPFLLVWVGVMRWPCSSNRRPVRRAGKPRIRQRRSSACAVSLAWTAANAPERLAAIDHLADIEPVAQQMGEAAHPEGAPAQDAAVPKRALPGPDAAALKVLGQRPHRAKLQVTREYGAHDLGLRRHDDGFLIDRRITERDRSPDPDPFALRRRDLVAHPFADHLSLELGERQQDIEREPPHAGCGTEGLRNRYE